MGRLFDGLTQLRIDENTIVVFMSDNGPLPIFRAHDQEIIAARSYSFTRVVPECRSSYVGQVMQWKEKSIHNHSFIGT